jgi:hypothetical protein
MTSLSFVDHLVLGTVLTRSLPHAAYCHMFVLEEPDKGNRARTAASTTLVASRIEDVGIVTVGDSAVPPCNKVASCRAVG